MIWIKLPAFSECYHNLQKIENVPHWRTYKKTDFPVDKCIYAQVFNFNRSIILSKNKSKLSFVFTNPVWNYKCPALTLTLSYTDIFNIHNLIP